MRGRIFRFRLTSLVAGLLLATAAGSPQDPGAPSPAAQGPTRSSTVPAYRQANKVAVLTVHGEIDRVTLHSLERRVREAMEEGADAIALDINTPGGALDATLDIVHLIRTDCPGNTVAWINPFAYSAGTIIALAANEIVVAPSAAFGDAAPITVVPLPPAERAKAESPVLTEVVDSARRNHYDEKLVQAFVSVGVELWLIEHKKTGEQIFVDREEYRLVFGEDPPAQLTPVAPPAGTGSPGPRVKPWFEQMFAPAPGSLAGGAANGAPPDPAELQRQIEAEQNRPSARRALTRADRGDWRLIRQVVSSDRLLTLKPAEAAYYGLSQAVIANDAQLKAFFGASELVRYDRVWSESLVRFLTSWWVRGVLMVIFVICFLIELAAPGTGVFGVTAGVSLLILIGAPWLAGMAQWWEILLIGVGLCLVLVELFVIPGFGVAGLLGAGCILVGIVGTFVSGPLSTPTGQSELAQGLTATLTAAFAAAVAAWFLFRNAESLPFVGRFILKTEIARPGETTSATGGTGGGLLESMAGTDRPLAVGDEGIAETDLRPAGRVVFQGRPVDVKSISSYIERGRRVRVVSVGRFAIEVEEVEA